MVSAFFLAFSSSPTCLHWIAGHTAGSFETWELTRELRSEFKIRLKFLIIRQGAMSSLAGVLDQNALTLR